MVFKFFLLAITVTLLIYQTSCQMQVQLGNQYYTLAANDGCQANWMDKSYNTMWDAWGHMGQAVHKTSWDSMAFLSDCLFNFRCRFGKTWKLIKNAAGLLGVVPEHTLKLAANMTYCVLKDNLLDVQAHNCNWDLCLQSCSSSC